MSSSLARLTSLSTQTLTLLRERQRLSTISTSSGATLSFASDEKIRRNLITLREGIVLYEKTNTTGKGGAKELKEQFERMRETFGDESVETLVAPVEEEPQEEPPHKIDIQQYVPYRDEPIPSPSVAPTPSDLERGYGGHSDGELFQVQQQLMEDQDVRLDTLSHSINRQRDISLQINSELDVHTGLLEGLDQDLDRTGDRLGAARRGLNKFAKGVKGNGSSLFIGLLITVLLLLIVIFKT